MSNSGETATFSYNADGLRVKKVCTTTGTTNYTLHGKNLVHLSNNGNDLHFFYDAQNRPAVVVFNGTAYGYVHNLQGDIVAIVNSAGTKVVEYTYDPWGKPLSKAGTLASTLGTLNPFRYRDYIYDEETELFYLNSRFYLPQYHRFLSVDNLITSLPNQFSYCSNRPIISHDPDGTDWETCFYDPEAFSNRSFFSCFSIADYMWGYQGNTCGIRSNYHARKNAQKAEENWINSCYNSEKSTITQEKVIDETFLPDKFYEQKAPKLSAPYNTLVVTHYNDYTGFYEISFAYYDKGGRQSMRIDWTNHGRNDHGDPHIHLYYYDSSFPEGKELNRIN